MTVIHKGTMHKGRPHERDSYAEGEGRVTTLLEFLETGNVGEFCKLGEKSGKRQKVRERSGICVVMDI